MEKGYVLKADDNFAEITINLNSGCSACANKGVCMVGDKPINLKVKNKIGMKKGDLVLFEISSSNRIMLSFLVFILPLINLFVGYYLGVKFYETEISGIIGASIGLIAGGTELVVLNKILKDSDRVTPQNIRVVNQEEYDNFSCSI
ncbi:MAG: SoxR reducing system RseC family protein [Candidatus Delongbacteria bacterium]|nr:SoxR reducing system RseC family protein [Candidatus Delongbacteria bacterium]